MKKTIILFSASLSVGLTPAFAKKLDCASDDFPKVKPPESIEQCENAIDNAVKTQCRGGITGSEFGELQRSYELGGCLKFHMDKALDVRLLKIKVDQPALFKKEMKLQKDFNLATEFNCQLLNDCEGSMHKRAQADCQNELYRWRDGVARKINEKRLEPGPNSDEKKINPRLKLAFLKNLCEMPADVFKDGKIPSNCEKRFRTDYLKALGGDCSQEGN
jgi:hypothetical protein